MSLISVEPVTVFNFSTCGHNEVYSGFIVLIVSVIFESMVRWQFKMSRNISQTSELQDSNPEARNNMWKSHPHKPSTRRKWLFPSVQLLLDYIRSIASKYKENVEKTARSQGRATKIFRKLECITFKKGVVYLYRSKKRKPSGSSCCHQLK